MKECLRLLCQYIPSKYRRDSFSSTGLAFTHEIVSPIRRFANDMTILLLKLSGGTCIHAVFVFSIVSGQMPCEICILKEQFEIGTRGRRPRKHE